MLCVQCGAASRLYAFDQRSKGWLRIECPKGHWGDVGLDSALLPKEVKAKVEELLRGNL